MDELAEEIAHREFMDSLAQIEERIFLSLLHVTDSASLKHEWDDLVVYGDEPTFASLIFDKMIEEADKCL
jgi:hypothetical protein